MLEDDFRKFMSSDRQYKVTIIAPTCFYYQVPLFRDLSTSDRIDLTVYFCSDEGVSGEDIKAAYRADGTWADEPELLKGFSYRFLKNHAPKGSYLKSLIGLANLSVWNNLRDDRPDLVVVTSWMNPTWWLVFIACIRFNIPMFFMTDANFFAEKFSKSWKAWIKRKALGKYLFPNTTGFLCAGSANRMLYEHYGVPAEKLSPFVYSWGYETLVEESGRLRGNKKEFRKKCGLPEDAFIVLYCGRLSPEKGSMDLLEAFKRVKHPKKALVLVGDGNLRNHMHQRVEAENIESVYFMGFKSRREIAEFYVLADIFVLPSHKETWGMVVNEALCFSLPVVASDQVGSAVDLICPGENGYIFPVGEIQNLADLISNLGELPEEELLKMGRESQSIVNNWNDKDPRKLLIDFLDHSYQIYNNDRSEVFENKKSDV